MLDAFHAKHTIAGVIEGGSDAVAGEYYGADYWARMWAKAHGIPSITEFADWDRFGRWAGPKRNKEMIDKYDPEAVIAFPGGAGTANTIKQACAAGIDVTRWLMKIESERNGKPRRADNLQPGRIGTVADRGEGGERT